MKLAIGLGLGTLAVGLCVSAASAGPNAGFGGSTPPEKIRLSDELSYSRSAHALRTANIRARPSYSGRVRGRLRLFTEDGFPEVYLLLLQRPDRKGSDWVKIRLPGRPNGRKGWVPRDSLGSFRLTRIAVVVDRGRLRITFLRAGERRWSAPIGIGAVGTPTPAGRFWIREQFPVRQGSIYGVYAFGTSAYSRLSDWPGGGVVGIHGTDAPSLIPGRPSHGCIRLKNRHVRWLARHLPTGAPVIVR